jgi:hypothetical protein
MQTKSVKKLLAGCLDNLPKDAFNCFVLPLSPCNKCYNNNNISQYFMQ